MAVQKWRGPPPRDAGSDPRECRKLAGVDNSTNSTTRPNLKQIPSRAALARRWPRLRVNRFTGRWRDDASGVNGADVTSLLSYIGEGTR